MGDAFRGLTIKLGADARPLQSAISSITRSASQAQSQLNKMNKALRFDGGNIAAMRAGLDLAGDKATHMARDVAKVSTAMRQAAQQTVQFSEKSGLAGGKLSSVARNTQDAYAQTQKLLSGYNHVNTELQHIYDHVERVAYATGKSSMGFKKLEDARKYVQGLRRDLSAGGDAASEAGRKLHSLIRSAAMTTDVGKAFNLDKSLPNASRLLGIWSELRREHDAFQNDLESMKKVEGFRAMRNELIAFKSGLKEAVSETVRFKAEMASTGSARGLSEAISYAKRLETAVEEATAHARTMDSAFDALPKSVEAARSKLLAAKVAQDSLTEKARSLKSAMDALRTNSALDEMAAKSTNVFTAFEKASHEAVELGTELKMAESRAEALNAELREANNIGFVGPRRSADAIKADLEKVNSELNEVRAKAHAADEALEKAAVNKQFAKLDADLAAVNTQLAEMRTKSSALTRMQNLGAGLRELGYGLYSTVTPAILMTGRYAIQAAEDIDSAYRDMRKTVNGSEEEFEALKQAAVEFSTTHITSADTILEIEAMGGQLGIAAKNLEGFSEVVSNLDIATDIGAEDLAKYIGQLSNIMSDFDQSNPEEYQKQITSFSDALVRLGNNSAAQESSIMKVMMRIASLGEISGMSTPQLLAISTAVAATGQGCEAAGTAISKTFSNIEAAVGAGGNKLQAFADVAGMSAQDFAKSWNETPVQAFTAFIEGLKRIDEEGGSVDSTLTGLKITSVRQKQALMGLTNTLDVLHDSLGMSQDAWNGVSTVMRDGSIERAGDAAREAQRKSEGFSGALGIMKNQAMALANELASGAAPLIRDLGELFGGLTKVVMALPDGMKTAVVASLALTAALGPVAVASGTMIRALSSVGKGVQSLRGGIILTGQKIQWMGAEMASSAGKVTKGAKVMHGVGKAVSALSSAKSLLGIAAVSIAIEKIVEAVGGYMEHIRNSEMVTRGVFSRMGIAVQQAAGVAESGSMRIAEAMNYKPTYGDWVDDLAGKFDTLQQKAKDTFANNALVEQYADRIAYFMKLAGESEAHLLNPKQQAELLAAVEAYNAATGESIEVIDAERAKLKDSQDQAIETAEAFDRLAEKKRIAAMRDYLNEEYTEKYKATREAAENLADAERKLGDLRREKAAIEATGIDYTNQSEDDYYNALSASIEDVEGDVEDYRKSLDGLNGDLEATNELMTLAAKAASDSGTALDYMLSVDASGIDISAYMEYSNKSLLDFADALDSCGKKAQELDHDKVYELAQAWDGSLASIMPKLTEYGIELDGLAKTQIGGIDFYVTDNGSIFDMQGKLAEFQTVTINDKHYYVTDDGSVYNEEMKLEGFRWVQVGDKHYIVTDDGTMYNEEGKLANLRGIDVLDKHYYVTDDGSVYDEIGKLGVLDDTPLAEKFVEVGDNGTTNDVKAKILGLERDINQLPGTTPTDITTNAPIATGEINTTYSALQRLRDNNTAHINIVTHKQENATGGIAAGLIRGVPRNASGAINGIVARPTLTNIGWTGEAGAEAILHMRNAGGAVIPLSNRRYVRPFARAVASEMGGGQTVVNNYYSIDGVTYEEGTDGAEAVKQLVHVTRIDSRRRGARRG